jgi:small subunit ribosomal protein S5
MATKSKQRISPNGLILKDQLISINRVTKVVKGGKNMSWGGPGGRGAGGGGRPVGWGRV